MTNTGKEYPDFFKVFLSQNHSERMLIPNAFVKLMQSKRRVLKDFILRDKRGSDWHVKARRIGDELYFDHGWKKFREENCLEENDFLVFTHIENNVFKFKILELSSMCEKIKVTNEEEENNNMEDVDKDEEEDGDDDGSDEDEEEDGGGDYEDVMTDEEEEEEEEEDDDDDADEDEDEDNDDDCIMKEEIDNVYKEFRRSEHQHCRNCKAWNIGSSSAGLNLEDDDDDDDIDAELFIQPGNPHFIAKHSRLRPNELHFPKNVIKDLCVCFTKSIKLVCCDCKDIQRNEIAAYHHILPQIRTANAERRGEIRTWKNGRVLALGWEDFRRKSKITENDRCICEIVLRNGEAIEMLRVHVVKKK